MFDVLTRPEHVRYLEVEPPTRTVQKWLFDEWPDAGARETMALGEEDGVTTLRWTLEFGDEECRAHLTDFDGQQDSLEEMEAILRSLLGPDRA